MREGNRSRVAVFTDVHGNAAALRAALADIDSRGDVERLYCLGDMIAIGPDTNEVLDILFARDDVEMISGNHEDAVLAVLDGRDPGSPGTERLHHIWIAQGIRSDHAAALRRLPRALHRRHGGQRLLLVHYHLREDGRFLPIDREPRLERLEALYRESGADAVCFGHHHPRHFFRSSHRVYVNPGALGCYHRAVARYAILSCGEGETIVDMRDIPYNNREFLASYARLSVPAGPFIIKTFHGNQSYEAS